jgi:glycosyltransferase involved in cell wall biosynthesis
MNFNSLGISAIVPTCERQVLLKRTLQSIASQELAPTEIIVVDDGGQGHENAIRRDIETWGFDAVQVVANSRAKGVSGARNTGAVMASGELLAFLDDDDEWLPSYLSEAQYQFELNDLDIVCTDMLCRFEDGIDRLANTAPDRLLPDLFLTRNPGFGGSNLIIRNPMYRAVGGFDESFPAAEDMDFGLRLSLRRNVKYKRLPKRLVRFHQHKGPKLCTPASDGMRAGIRRFYELHAHRMTEAQREEFRDNIRRFWGIDEYGNKLNLTPKASANDLLPTLKAWLDQQRDGDYK